MGTKGRVRFAPVTLVWALLTACVSCGPAEPGATTRPATAGGPAARASTALGTRSFELAPGSGAALAVDVPRAGVLSASALWKGGADIDVYITDSRCPGLDELVLGACTVLGRGDTPLGRPETARATVEAGRYQAFVLALGAVGDSGSVELALVPEAE